MPIPTVTMYGLAAYTGNARISAAPIAIAARRSSGAIRRGSEPLRKSTSEVALRPDRQGDEQRDIEHRLRPGRAERDLQQAHRHAEHHRRDRGARHAAQPAYHDDRHQRTDPA